jgi:transposase
MYIQIIPNRNSPPAVLLRESYREGGISKKRTLANLSGWPQEKIFALQAVLRGDAIAPKSAAAISRTDLEHGIRLRFKRLNERLNERDRRLLAAAEAEAFGRGGVSAVSRMTGLSRVTIAAGVHDLVVSPQDADSKKRLRKIGAGRKRLIEHNPQIAQDLESLVEPTYRGDPESPLRWTCKSLSRLAEQLRKMGHRISHTTVGQMLHEMGFSLQANCKTKEGAQHPDRNAQFEHINEKTKEFQASGNPVISVDTKKKELIGEFKNGGQEWHKKGNPEKVMVHDFMDPLLGRGIPYGIFDQNTNTGWVSVGVDHDTSVFSVETIRRWWNSMGNTVYPNAQRLLITADGGGSNGSRVRLWKTELQKLANEVGFPISVCHLPPGTSKWNKIEHRLFSFITQNWRGKPLISHEVMVNLIGATTTRNGLKVHAQLDQNKYPTGRKVGDRELKEVNIDRDDFHGEWNYTIRPRIQRN